MLLLLAAARFLRWVMEMNRSGTMERQPVVEELVKLLLEADLRR